MSKKKKLNEEAEDPQADIDTDLTSSISSYLDKYMLRLGWNNQSQREKFIDIVTEFIINGKKVNNQKMITNYIDKGLKVLNLELSKEKISTDNQDNEVDTDNIMESIDKSMHLNKRLTEARKNLIDRNYTISESKDITKYYLKENKKVGSLTNLNSLNEQEANEEKKDTYLTNFETFFRLYLTREYKWTSETANDVINLLIEAIDKASNDQNVQDNFDRRLQDLKKNIESVLKLKNSPNEHKNLDVARTEFKKYAVNVNNWNNKLFSSIFTTILQFLVNAKNVNVQRILIDKLNRVKSSLKDTSNKKDKEEEDKDDKKKRDSEEKEDKSKEKEEPKKDDTEKEDEGDDEEEKKKVNENFGKQNQNHPDYQAPHEQFMDQHGVQVDKAWAKLVDLMKADEMEVDEEKFEGMIDLLESKYDSGLVEKIIGFVIDKTSEYGDSMRTLTDGEFIEFVGKGYYEDEFTVEEVNQILDKITQVFQSEGAV